MKQIPGCEVDEKNTNEKSDITKSRKDGLVFQSITFEQRLPQMKDKDNLTRETNGSVFIADETEFAPTLHQDTSLILIDLGAWGRVEDA